MGATPIRLFDANAVPMDVSNGVAIPASTSGLLIAGQDENAVARNPLVESKANAAVNIDIGAYGARFSPANATFTAGPLYTRTAFGHVATSALTEVKIVESGTVVGMFFGAATGTTSFKVASSSANDAAAGTGIRSINIVYIGTDGLRYFTTATMNGTTVVTVALSPSAIGIERVYAASAGTGLVAAGTITVKNSTSATVMGQVNTGSTTTVSTETHCQAGKTLYLKSIRYSAVTTATTFSIVYFSWDYTNGTATGAQQFVVEQISAPVGSSSYSYASPIAFTPPANQIGRLWATTKPSATTASNYYLSMDTWEA